VTRGRPDFGFYDGESPEREVAFTGSSLNEAFALTDENTSDVLYSQRQSGLFEEDPYRQLRKECEALRKEKIQYDTAVILKDLVLLTPVDLLGRCLKLKHNLKW